MGDSHQELLDCPFCKFTTKGEGHYEILFHVETAHPESSHPSPFAVNDADREVDSDDVEDMEGTKANLPKYIECQCGEYCLLDEFESHLEMHYAEGMSFDETQRSADAVAPNFTLRQGRASSPAMESPPQNTGGSLPFDPCKALRSSVASHGSRSDGRKSQGLVQDFIGVLRHSTAPTSRKIASTRHRKDPRRLGVRFAHCCLTSITDGGVEEGTGATCSRRTNAGVVTQAVGAWSKGVHFQSD